MTLPQECGDVIGGVVGPKIREEGKKSQKKFLLSWSPKRGLRQEVGGGVKDTDLRLCGGPDYCQESPHSRPCRGPPGYPRSSQSPPGLLREEHSPEVPQGHHRPTEQHCSPILEPTFAPSHLSSVTSPLGDQKIRGWPGWGPMDQPSVHRGSLQIGDACAQEVWMQR